MKRALGEEIIASRVPLIILGMRKHCSDIIEELKTINDPEEISGELKQKIDFVMNIYKGLEE